MRGGDEKRGSGNEREKKKGRRKKSESVRETMTEGDTEAEKAGIVRGVETPRPEEMKSSDPSER